MVFLISTQKGIIRNFSIQRNKKVELYTSRENNKKNIFRQKNGNNCENAGDDIHLTGKYFPEKGEQISIKIDSTGDTTLVNIDQNGSFSINLINAGSLSAGLHQVIASHNTEQVNHNFSVIQCTPITEKPILVPINPPIIQPLGLAPLVKNETTSPIEGVSDVFKFAKNVASYSGYGVAVFTAVEGSADLALIGLTLFGFSQSNASYFKRKYPEMDIQERDKYLWIIGDTTNMKKFVQNQLLHTTSVLLSKEGNSIKVYAEQMKSTQIAINANWINHQNWTFSTPKRLLTNDCNTGQYQELDITHNPLNNQFLIYKCFEPGG